MYPARVPDTVIRTLIRELTEEGVPPSGARVRAELAARFGHRGGVARIYRLLREARPAPGAAPAAELERELAAARERAALAEHREEQHQARWARELDALRQRLAEVAVRAERVRELEAQNLELRRRLAVLERGRAGELPPANSAPGP